MLLQAWAAEKRAPADDAPKKLIYPLEHAYTPAELGFGTLKGVDAAVAGVLAGAAQKSGFDLHLALLSIEESGTAECSAYYGPGRRRSSEAGEFEAGEVDERHVSLSEWRRLDGSASVLGQLPVEDEELSPPDALDDMEPDEEEFQEATGNEGATFERTYRRAALVLWPHERFLAVLNQAGLPVTLPHLADLTERWGGERRGWATAAVERGSRALRPHAVHLAERRMVSAARQDTERGRPVLTLLTRLGDTERLEAFLAGILSRGLYDKGRQRRHPRRARPVGGGPCRGPSLVCAKNRASHERRVKQRSRDLSDLQRLEASTSC